MLLVVSIVSASCVFDADRCVISADEQYGVMFTVSLSGQQTRASWGEGYDPSKEGDVFDYRIMPDELHMAIFTEHGVRLGVINDLDYWPINENHTEYQFMGQMPKECMEYLVANGEVPTNFRFMVLANCSDHSSGEEYITYSHTQLDPSSKESSIPMWGVKVADVSPLYSRGNLDVGDISLLRAAAKVEVKLSDKLKSEGATINSATLKYYNQTGYVLPSGWSQVAETKQLSQDGCYRIYRHAAVNLPFIQDTKTGVYYLYVAEYDNINYPGERNKISLDVTVGGRQKTFEDAISFCQYENGAPTENSHYNIVRNHIYEFEILSIAGSNLLLDYTVADWATEDWDGNGKEYEEHDLSYPTYHNPVVPYEFLGLASDQQSSYVITKEPQMYYGGQNNLEAGAFHCYFQILAPSDVQWKPVFMGTKENYRIRVYGKTTESNNALLFDTDVTGMQNNLGTCGAGEWFHIVVFPLSHDGENSTSIEFGISYYQKWTDQYINLYVNGEYNNIKWPNSGDNPKIINIKHTSAQ